MNQNDLIEAVRNVIDKTMCPVCGAPEGSKCTWEDDVPHVERVQLYWEKWRSNRKSRI